MKFHALFGRPSTPLVNSCVGRDQCVALMLVVGALLASLLTLVDGIHFGTQDMYRASGVSVNVENDAKVP